MLRPLFACLLCLAVGHVRGATAPYPTAGGEGGKVITVTTLADAGPGSLRAALAVAGPRVVRFDVGGEIWLKEPIVVQEPFVTLDGASAPAPGITILGDTVRVKTHDAIVRHVRIRPGALLENSDPSNRDSLGIDGSEGQLAYNVLVENCSFSWSIDENLEIWGGANHDVVIRRCLIAEGLSVSIHPKGRHSAGIIVGPGSQRVLIQENVFAHNGFRNPVIHGGAEATVVNNLIYDPGFGGLMVYCWKDGGPTLVTAVGNAIIAGPSTRPRLRTFHENGIDAGSRIYLADNLVVGTKALDRAEVPPLRQDQTAPEGGSPFVDQPPVPLGELKPLPAKDVEEVVLREAGARPRERDAVDARIVDEVKKRGGEIRNWPTDSRLMPDIAP